MLVRSSPFARRAFTLIEMLVAMVLSALLMLVLLSVSRQTLALRESAVEISQQIQGTELLQDQFERDFSQADRIMVLPDGVILQGAIYRGGRDGLIANHQAATVRYRVVWLPSRATNSSDSFPWLFREQSQRDSATQQEVGFTREPLWRGVSRMLVTSNTIAALSDASEAEILLGEESQAPVDAMPDNVRVELLDAMGNLFFGKTIYHHWED